MVQLDQPQTDYSALSLSAETVVYGRVEEFLGKTKETTTLAGTSITITAFYESFLIRVLQSVMARGGQVDQPPPQGTLVIRQQVTAHSPQFAVGETFVVFLKRKPDTGTYYVHEYTGSGYFVRGKLPVVQVHSGAVSTRTEPVDSFLQNRAQL